jgi:AcrR family transcriptional regulator
LGVKERRAREKEGLRQEILDAARELFVREGYEAVSMRKIAGKIEYSPTTIYLHFRDKSELFDCLSTEAFGKLLEKLQSIGCETPSDDPVECLRRGMLAYIEFGLENPDHYKITFLMEERAAARREVGCQSFGCLQAAVGACIQAGRFRVIDQELASQILWAGAHGLTSLLIVHPEFPWVDRDALTLGMIDTLLKGLLK